MNLLDRINKARPNFGKICRKATGQVGPRKYKYATLDSILEAIETPLMEQGVSIFSRIVSDEGDRFILRTTIACADAEEEIHSDFPLTKTDDPQRLGSSMTYGRRYNISALLNLTTDDDDDGDSASNNGNGSTAHPPAQKKTHPPAHDLGDAIAQTDIQLRRLQWDTETGRNFLKSKFGKHSRRLLTPEEMQQFLHHLKTIPTPAPVQ
ncbi:MAG: ERF family protein [Limnospira sp.]